MFIVCTGCGKRHKLKSGKVPENLDRLRCKQCKGKVELVKAGEEKGGLNFFDRELALQQLPRQTVITVTNQKGGVAKTTTCLNLGLSLVLLKKKVLLIDFDAQANLSLALGYRNRNSFFEMVDSGADSFGDYIIPTRYAGLFILPSNVNMSLLNKRHFGKRFFEFLLRDRLNLLKDEFDYILIDTPPAIEFFTLNALTASRMAIIPCPCEFLAADGVKKIQKLINLMHGKINPDLVFRVLITMYRKEEVASKLIYTKLRELYGDRMLDTIIADDSKIKESQIVSLPAIAYDRKSMAGLQHVELAKEIVRLLPAGSN